MAPHLPRVLQVLCSAARAALPSLPTARRPARALPAPRPTHAHASQERSAEVSAAGAAWPVHPSGQAWQKALQLAACTSNPPHANAQGALLERMDTHWVVCCTHAGHWLPTSKPPPPAYYLIPPLPPRAAHAQPASTTPRAAAPAALSPAGLPGQKDTLHVGPSHLCGPGRSGHGAGMPAGMLPPLAAVAGGGCEWGGGREAWGRVPCLASLLPHAQARLLAAPHAGVPLQHPQMLTCQ